MTAQVIDLVFRRAPNLRAREKALNEQAEHQLRELEETLSDLAMVRAEICGKDPDAMDDDKACRYMAFHTAGMLEAYAKRNRIAQQTFEEKLKRKGLWPPK